MGGRLQRLLDLVVDHAGNALFVVYATVAVAGVAVGVVVAVLSVV